MTIDWWTLGIQTINVAILVWLLQRFFWRPVAAIIEQRRDATRRTLAEAAASRAEAVAALADIERTRAGFAAEREAILAEAREAADKLRTARLAEAENAAASVAAAARAAIQREDQAAEQAWNQRSAELAVAIAGQLAARLGGAAVREAFLNWLLQAIASLPEVTRQAVLASGAALEVVSASPLAPAEQERMRVLIDKAFSGAVALEFRTDPALISGLELHGPHLLVSNSWRGDLARILADLGDGDANDAMPHRTDQPHVR